jgi:hypothetical protein
MDPGSHVGFQISTKNTNLVENHPMNISVKFGWNLFSGFREANWIVTLQEWSLGGLVLHLWIVCRSEIQNGHHDSTWFNIGPYGNFTFSSFFLKPQNRFEPNLVEMFIAKKHVQLDGYRSTKQFMDAMMTFYQ